MKLIDYPDAEMMAIDLADVMAHEIAEALHHEDRVSIAVPGGTTPGPIFDALCGVDLDWGRVDVMLTDERWVPESSERSNTRLLRARLLTDKAAAANLVPLYAPADTPEAALPDLALRLGPKLPLTLVLLGMGTDMHTASLFPGADRLEEALAPDAPLLVAMRAPGAPEPRVTLSAPVLAGAMSTHVVITGEDKKAALKRAEKSRSPQEAPISAFLRDATVHWAP